MDANVALSAIIRPDGWVALQLRRADLWLISPYHTWIEVEEARQSEARRKICSHPEWTRRVAALRERIITVSTEALVSFEEEPAVRKAVMVDPKDAPYLACLLAARADYLWTFDKALHEAFPGVAVPIIPED